MWLNIGASIRIVNRSVELFFRRLDQHKRIGLGLGNPDQQVDVAVAERPLPAHFERRFLQLELSSRQPFLR